MVNYLSDRISYSEKEGELRIVISAKVEQWQETLLTVWLVAWTFCGIYVLSELFGDYTKEEKLIMFVYLVFWAYFEWKLLYAFAWRKWGVELIRVVEGCVQLKTEIKGYGEVKTYDFENIKTFKCLDTPTKSFAKVMGNSFWNVTEKAISFEYFGKLIAFGIQLNSKDSKKISKKIVAHLRKKA